MIVDFFGLPGTGKTTLDKEIQSRLIVSPLKTKYYIKQLFAKDSLAFMWKLLKILKAKKKKESRDIQTIKTIIAVYNRYMGECKNLSHKNEIRIYDNGIAQSLLSLVWMDYKLKPLLDDVFSFLQKQFKKNKGLAFVYAYNNDMDLIKNRIYDRADVKRVKLLEHDQLLELLEFQKREFDLFYHKMKIIGMACIVDTNDPTDINSELIIRYINEVTKGANKCWLY